MMPEQTQTLPMQSPPVPQSLPAMAMPTQQVFESGGGVVSQPQARPLSRFTPGQIVIAIAVSVLLLTILIVAVTGGQRASRDAKRQQDLFELAAFVQAYSAQNNGRHPNTQTELDALTKAFFADRNDPSTNAPYQIIHSTDAEDSHDAKLQAGQILYGRQHFCSPANGTILDDASAHEIKDHYFIVYQEKGDYHCIDNHAR
jgi:type II secretory pathway pseudopilin PulG